VRLKARVTDIEELPETCRARVRGAESQGHAWAAWTTVRGVMVARGTYDLAGSMRLRAHLLVIDWFTLPGGHRSMWCYCYPNRPTEWIVGRGMLADPH